MTRVLSRTRILVLFLLAFIMLAGCVVKKEPAAQAPERLPFSDKIVYGKLDNGLQYYIRQNDFPKDKIELRLNVRSGSLNETEAERGVAHFVEHMAFNGTTHFPDNSIIKFMEKAGLTFGKHSNAYTATDNTNYQLSIPADNATLLDESFKIMRDWADGILFEQKEIDKEKGVITEEWRSRNSVQNRLRILSREYFLEGSLYPERDPIGLMNVIAGADSALLKGYYDKWYTPGNMSVIVVGNIEPSEAKALISKYFETMAPEETPQKADTTVPIKEGLRVRVISDPEATSTSVGLTYFEDEGQVETYPHLKRNLLESGAMYMLNKRVGNEILEKKIDLLSFRGAKANMGNNLSYAGFSIATRPDTLDEDVKAMLIEIERVKRYGFTQSELDEFIASQKTSLYRAANPDYKFPSEKYAGIIIKYDTTGGYLTEFAQDKELIDRIFSETALDNYNAAFNRLLTNGSSLIIVTVPEADYDKIDLTNEKFLSAQIEVSSMELKPQTGIETVKTLLDKAPEGGVIRSRTAYNKVDGELVIYENGVRLFIKNNPVDKNRYVLNAKKPGGLSVLNDSDVFVAEFMSKVLGASGFSDIPRRQIQSFMAGKQAGAGPAIGGNVFEFAGGGDTEDMETAFQLLYKYIITPNIDKDALSAIMTSSETSLKNAEKDKQTLFSRELSKQMYNSAYRRGYVLSSDLPGITSEKIMSLYKTNFSDINNFMFVIAGDVDRDKVAELGRVYLGGLPAVNTPAKATDRGVRLKQQFNRVEGAGDVENRSTVSISFDKDVDYFDNGSYYASLLRRILNQRLRENIREDKGGVYSVSVALAYSDFPGATFGGKISFTCDPARKDELINEVLSAMKVMAKKGVTSNELKTAKSQQMVQFDNIGEENKYWANTISYDFIKGEPVLSIPESKELVSSLSLTDTNKFANEYMSDMRVFVAVYNPEEKSGSGK